MCKQKIASLITKKKTGRKSGSKNLERDGKKVSSQLGALFYDAFKEMQSKGDIQYFLRHIPFYLPDKSKYVVDFMVYGNDRNIYYYDIKGNSKGLSFIKKRITQQVFPIKITTLTREDLINYIKKTEKGEVYDFYEPRVYNEQ